MENENFLFSCQYRATDFWIPIESNLTSRNSQTVKQYSDI